MTDNINGIPIRWNAEADRELLGAAGVGLLATQTGFNENKNSFPAHESPFGSSSLFNGPENGEYVEYVNFKRLIPYIIQYKGEIAPYYYKDFESHATIPIGFPPFGPLETSPDDNEDKEEAEENADENDPYEFFRDFFDEKSYRNLFRRRVDKEYKDESKTLVFLDGKLNTREGYIKITKNCIGFDFVLDVPGRKCRFIDFFYYVEPETGVIQKDWAMSIEAFRYEDYQGLCKAEGLVLTENVKKGIVTKFMAALNAAEGIAKDMAWLYFKMPDFVYAQRDKNKLIDDLATILKGKVTEGAINTEVMVLKILQAFVTDKREDQDNLLTQLTTRYIDGDTLFEVLYDKMNDFGGADNWTAAIKLLYKIWSGSKFADEGYYTYNGQPETLAYQSKKILGFYQSGFTFSFEKDQVEVYKEVEQYYGERRIFEDLYFTRYSILQPIQLLEVDQDGALKIPDRIPAFYLKAFDDKNTWENFEKSAWLALDVLTTFTAVGNLLKLRYLVHISKGMYYLKLASGVVQLASGIAGVLLNFVDNCGDGTFCQKLRNYLFWLDIATISVDAITERMLRRSAREALDEMSETIRRQQPSIKEHLDEMAEAGTRASKNGDLTKSFFENAGIAIREERAIGKVIGQTEEFTCVAGSLRMVLDDIGIIRSEQYLAAELRTTKSGASILDIPDVLKNTYLDDIKTIARGGKKDINVKLSTLESALKTGKKKAVVSVVTEDFGAHAVIVDKIENGRVFVRDPLPLYQGSSYSTTVEDFAEVFNRKFVTIKK
jgi:hypothetical protein